MLRSLNSGVSGMQQFQESMDVIGNNIANVDTVGFKGARVDFEDTLSQTMGADGNSDPIQVGTGVTTAAITNSFTQGALNNTNTQSDIAVNGQGFFIVIDPVSQATYVTRAGNFRVDQNGFLVTPSGMQVQGYTDGTVPHSTQGALKIDLTNAPAASIANNAVIANYSVDATGTINVRLSDGAQYIAGQVLLQNFTNPDALTKQGSNLYSVPPAAGGSVYTAPKVNGLGPVVGGALESSNVDLANEFANMITTQRGFQANARVITTSDEILQELVNLKR